MSLQEAVAEVKKRWPATLYANNDFLPPENEYSLSEPWDGELTQLRIGLNWIKNDEIAPLYVGIERGYFKSVGIDLEILPGGPGRQPLSLLVGGHLDVYMEATGSNIIWAAKSETPVQLKVVGAILNSYPYSFITLDRHTPSTERSSKVLGKDDFVGKKLGLSPATPDYMRRFFFDRTGLKPSELQIVTAGATLEPMIAGVYDFYGSWMDNDPRMLDHLGYRNWVYWSFPDNGWSDIATLVTVMPKTLEERPDLIRRFLKALTLATCDTYEDMDFAAAATLKHVDSSTSLTEALIKKRLEFQATTVRPRSSDLPVLTIDTNRLDEVAAQMLRYGSISLEN